MSANARASRAAKNAMSRSSFGAITTASIPRHGGVSSGIMPALDYMPKRSQRLQRHLFNAQSSVLSYGEERRFHAATFSDNRAGRLTAGRLRRAAGGK